MITYIQNIFTKDKAKKPPLRDKDGRVIKGKPHYLVKVPWHRRNPRLFVFSATVVTIGAMFSAPIYYNLMNEPEDFPPQAEWWPHEIRQGKREIDIIRERKARAPKDAKLSDFFKRYNPETEHLLWGDRARPVPTPGIPPLVGKDI